MGNDPQSVRVFLAALQGICANEYFFGPTMQQSPQAAVEFAFQCVKACCDEKYGQIIWDQCKPAERMEKADG